MLKILLLREQDKHFLSSIYSAIAIIFVWKGIWNGIYEIPYINDPFVFLFVGFAMLTLSGIIFQEFDPLGGVEKAISRKMAEVAHDKEKQHYQISYEDKHLKKNILVEAKDIEKVEGKAIIIRTKDRKEMFIPYHRIKEIIYKGKAIWRQ